MVLEVWAEKYRPGKLSEVINQKHVVERVKAFVKEKSIPHLLFAGPAGTGKTSIALCIARELYGKSWRQNVLELNASVTPDTPVMIRRNGKVERTTIGELASRYFKDENSKYAFPKNLEVLSLDKEFKVKFMPVRNISRHKTEKIARVRFEGGEIKTTLSHSVMVVDEKGRLKEKMVSEIRKGDLLISFKTRIEGNEKELDLSKFAPCEWINLARFLKNEFYANGLKKIPSFVFNWPISLRHAFLQGYQGDASGEWNEFLRYSSKSRSLLTDVAWLGRISELHTSSFERETRIIWNKIYAKEGLVAATPLINFLKSLGQRVKFNWRYLLRHQLYSKKSKRVRKELAKKILAMIKKEELNKDEKKMLDHLTKLLNSDLCFVSIKQVKIEDYDGYVYDVSVPGAEMFWGGTVPILLHNSDARGIDVIRGQVKDFARTKPLGEVPYKIIILDEADALTPDAQQALRRTMETFTSVSRFCLICNFSSKIIEPIQSRCAVFRFKALSDSDVKRFIERIVKNEKLKISEDGIKALIEISEGDLRKVANLLQACASLKARIEEEVVYDVASRAKPTDVKEMLELALKGKFEEARKKLQQLLLRQGLAGVDIIAEIHRQIYSLPLSEEAKAQLVEKCGEFEYRLSMGGNELIQLEALLAQFLLFARGKG